MILLILAAIALLASPVDTLPVHAPRARVEVDSARHLIRIQVGRWDIPPSDAGYGHAGHGGPDPEVFDFPVDGWVHGIGMRLTDGGGRELPRTLLHHLAVINFARRQLLKGTPERLVAFGQETEDMHLPATVGIPMSKGMPMVVALAWFNPGDAVIRGASAELEVEWTPANIFPRPATIYPVSMDMVDAQGVNSGYDLPRGFSRQSIEFSLPVSGRVIAAGGHLHDYGRVLTLADALDSTRHIITLASRQDDSGRVVGMQRVTPGLGGRGIPLQGGHRYLLAAENMSPAPRILPRQAMGYMVLLFQPDARAVWPHPDTASVEWRSEYTYLFGGGMHMH